MFTADPATGDTARVVIEAAYGLGEVGGELEPDLYVVAKQWPRLLHVRIGNKTHRAASPDGTVNRPTSPRRRAPAGGERHPDRRPLPARRRGRAGPSAASPRTSSGRSPTDGRMCSKRA